MGALNKVMTAEEAVSRFIHDGDDVAIGGFSTNRKPYAIIREVIRQGKKDLVLETSSGGGTDDMLIGCGLVKAINVGYIANAGYSMVCRRFRKATEGGTLPFEDYSIDVQTIAYHGAALGLPYVPIKNMLGSDLEAKWGISEEQRKAIPKLPPKKFVIQDDPFQPGNKLCLVPTPKIDVAIIHVQTASPSGICRIMGTPFQDEDIAIAAKHTIVSCEELVSEEEIRRNPELNTLPGLVVDAVVHAPWGAHPSQVFGYYDYDPQALIQYENVSKTDEDFAAYIRKYVMDAKTDEEYLDLIGKDHLETLKVDPELGFARNLPRK